MVKYVNGVPNAPEAIGAYSQAVIVDNLAFVSGQLPLDPKSGKVVEGGMEEQTDRVMKNLAAILGHMNSDFSSVVKATIYTTDLSQFHILNGVYAKWMGALRPARATVQVAALPMNALIEIETIVMLTPPQELMLFRPGESETVGKTNLGVPEMKSPSLRQRQS